MKMYASVIIRVVKNVMDDNCSHLLQWLVNNRVTVPLADHFAAPLCHVIDHDERTHVP